MPVRLSRATVVLGIGAVVFAGLTTPADAATRATVKVSASSKHKVTAPSSLRPGLVHVVNTGSREVLVMRKKSKGLSTFVADYNKYVDTAGSIRFHKDFDVVDRLAPRADEYVRLARGTFYLADADVKKLTASLVHTLTVSGATSNASAPRSTAVTTTARGTVTRSVRIGKNTFAHIVNGSATPHIVSVQVIRPSVTAKQIRAAIDDPAHHDPFKLTGSYFAPLGYLAGHTATYKRITQARGRYFVFSASLTKPGLAKGRIGLFTVS